MFYTPHVLFIHVPRSGGTWLKEWAKRTIRPKLLSIDMGYLKHMSHNSLVSLIPSLQQHISFAVRRDEDERFESYRKLALDWKMDPTIPLNTTVSGWAMVVDAARSLNADDFRRHWFHPFESYIGPSTMVMPFERDMPLLTKWLVKIHSGLTIDRR